MRHLRFKSIQKTVESGGSEIMIINLFKPIKEVLSSIDQMKSMKNVTQLWLHQSDFHLVQIDKRAKSIRFNIYLDISKQKETYDGKIIKPARVWITNKLFANRLEEIRKDRNKSIADMIAEMGK